VTTQGLKIGLAQLGRQLEEVLDRMHETAAIFPIQPGWNIPSDLSNEVERIGTTVDATARRTEQCVEHIWAAVGRQWAQDDEDARVAELRQLPYADYLKSQHWLQRRMSAMVRPGACQVCGSPKDLDVHHNTYANLGREKEEDLTVLCRDCHRLFHENKKLAQ
jgi:5-methylcytosine-specific restriction endonuclease McrA